MHPYRRQPQRPPPPPASTTSSHRYPLPGGVDVALCYLNNYTICHHSNLQTQFVLGHHSSQEELKKEFLRRTSLPSSSLDTHRQKEEKLTVGEGEGELFSDFSFVGTTERLVEVVDLLSIVFPDFFSRNLYPTTKNVGNRPRSDTSRTEHKQIEEFVKLDRRTYEFAENRFRRHYEKCVKDPVFRPSPSMTHSATPSPNLDQEEVEWLRRQYELAGRLNPSRPVFSRVVRNK
jgi:hypothetical protein